MREGKEGGQSKVRSPIARLRKAASDGREGAKGPLLKNRQTLPSVKRRVRGGDPEGSAELLVGNDSGQIGGQKDGGRGY